MESRLLLTRQRVLLWTSLWILVPWACWRLSCALGEPECYWRSESGHLLFFATLASLNHWWYNEKDSWRHKTDVAVALITLGVLILNIASANHTLALILFTSTTILFCTQRILQRSRPVDWTMVTFLHICMRYLLFWFAMRNHLPADLPSYVKLTGFVSLTVCYAIHIAYLCIEAIVWSPLVKL